MTIGVIAFLASTGGNPYAFLVGLFLVPLGAIIFVSNNNRDAQGCGHTAANRTRVGPCGRADSGHGRDGRGVVVARAPGAGHGWRIIRSRVTLLRGRASFAIHGS